MKAITININISHFPSFGLITVARVVLLKLNQIMSLLYSKSSNSLSIS